MIKVIIGAIVAFSAMFGYACCKVSSICSREEESWQMDTGSNTTKMDHGLGKKWMS